MRGPKGMNPLRVLYSLLGETGMSTVIKIASAPARAARSISCLAIERSRCK